MNKKIDLSRYEGHTEGPWLYGGFPFMVYTPHEPIRERNEDGEIGCFDLEDCKRRSKEAYERDGEDSDGCDLCGGPYLLVDKNHICLPIFI